jgi:ectoine hydroxylase-related dioxygenase (phytanoyl-CoA dioxygenase family)
MDLDALHRRGFCVVRGVLDDADERRRELLADPSAHSRGMWRIRTTPRVRACFEALWNEPLLVSFDGATIKEPGEPGLELGYHVDQEIVSDECICVQGVVALTESSARTGSVVLVPGSHRHFAALVHRHGEPVLNDVGACDGRWQGFGVPDDDVIFRQCLPPEQPTLAPGDAVFWDSRLLHAVPAAEDPWSERVVAYVSMAPRRWASERTLRARERAFRSGAATTHWPYAMYRRRGALKPPTQIINEILALV